jgi:hypothetical protein
MNPFGPPGSDRKNKEGLGLEFFLSRKGRHAAKGKSGIVLAGSFIGVKRMT